MIDGFLKKTDPELHGMLVNEDERQESNLEMIASENFVSRSVLEAYTSTLTNKYAEGYPGRRYYNGCDHADAVETLAIERAKKMFGSGFANVQPHSGAQANMAVFLAFLQPGDTFMGMDLSHGGHLSHGSKANFSGKYFNVVSYGVRKEDARIDYDEVLKKARETKPKLIVAGFSAYPRTMDFAKFREIADDVGAVLMADVAHIAGLIVAGEHPTSIGNAHITTTTTHKTLRGPRGGLILSDTEEHNKILNSRVFPGVQGGPLMHVIAAKAAAFGEALTPEYKSYMKRVVENAKVMADTFMGRGFDVVSGGTDNHLVLLNVGSRDLTGHAAANAMDEVGITANKNGIPFDPHPPTITSGVRLGSPALTTRGFGKDEFIRTANLICDLLENMEDPGVRQSVKAGVKELSSAFPMTHFRL
ncbi:MAG: serine hydroxymethyltransferase [Spirochaetia bacterium]|nr:serine hydroxymethyltransferase [Spirochaetia bacterium]